MELAVGYPYSGYDEGDPESGLLPATRVSYTTKGTPIVLIGAVTEKENKAPLLLLINVGLPLPPNVNVGELNADASAFVGPLALATTI